MEKDCTKCKRSLLISSFGKHKCRKDGLQSICKECKSTKDKEYYLANKTKIIERTSGYNRFNKSRHNLCSRNYYLKNIDRHRYWVRKRRLRIKNIPGYHTYKEWLELVEKYNHYCLRCGSMEPFVGQFRKLLTEDHVIPINKENSTDYIDNIQPLCFNCNSSKKDSCIDYRPCIKSAETIRLTFGVQPIKI